MPEIFNQMVFVNGKHPPPPPPGLTVCEAKNISYMALNIPPAPAACQWPAILKRRDHPEDEVGLIKKITQTAVINIVFQRIFIKNWTFAGQHTVGLFWELGARNPST